MVFNSVKLCVNLDHSEGNTTWRIRELQYFIFLQSGNRTLEYSGDSADSIRLKMGCLEQRQPKNFKTKTLNVF
jgi:hypothetical protein